MVIAAVINGSFVIMRIMCGAKVNLLCYYARDSALAEIELLHFSILPNAWGDICWTKSARLSRSFQLTTRLVSKKNSLLKSKF